jgi:hypothetical protein
MSAIVQQDGSLERLLTELEFDIHGLVEYQISTGWRVSLPTIGLCGICYVSGSPCRMIVGRSPQCWSLRILLQLSHPERARFVAAVGAPPFVVLRELRMRRAAELLASEAMTIENPPRNTRVTR